MNESTTSRTDAWRERFSRLRIRFQTAGLFASGVAAALVALLIYNALFPAPQPMTERQLNDTVAMAMASATPPPAFSARVYGAIQPSLVLIQSRTPGGEEGHGRSLGSGVIINANGDILTSLHVVDNAESITVTFFDGTESNAAIIAAEPEKDIAVLSASQLPETVVPAVLGNPNAMNIGDEAYAVGNPFGLYGSMSVGVISGFERSFRSPETGQPIEGLIQIDAAVNPGNSGGPLLNRDGHVVGIVVGILNPTEQDFFIGIGFAVPIDIAAGAAGSPPY